MDGANVHPASNFTVQHGAGTILQPPQQQVVQPSDTVLVWKASYMPALPATIQMATRTTTYTVTLAGDGANPIKSRAGRRLDGELGGFDSGNGVEGGNAIFSIKLVTYRETDPNIDKNFPHGGVAP